MLGSRVIDLLLNTPVDEVPEGTLANFSSSPRSSSAAAPAAAGSSRGGSGLSGDGVAAQQTAAAAATAVAERAESGAAASSSGRGAAEEVRQALGEDVYDDPALVALAEVVSWCCVGWPCCWAKLLHAACAADTAAAGVADAAMCSWEVQCTCHPCPAAATAAVAAACSTKLPTAPHPCR